MWLPAKGDGPGSGELGAAISSSLWRTLSGASARLSSGKASSVGSAELARQTSSLPLLAYQEGEGFVGGRLDPEDEHTTSKVSSRTAHCPPL